MEETRQNYPDGCPTGQAVISGAGNLPARYVVHAVGPRYRDGQHGEPKLLASAYRRSLEVAAEHGCRSVAFPSLSTGAYGYPLEEAAPIAVQTVVDFLKKNQTVQNVRFVLFGQAAYDAFARALDQTQKDGSESGA